MEDETQKIPAIEAEYNRIMQSIEKTMFENTMLFLSEWEKKKVALLIVANIQRSHLGDVGQTLFYSKLKNFIASKQDV
jgi:hypothetical protein